MAIELKIRWDGDAPGLAEHRVSIASFGESLGHLLAAVRRIATQLVMTATEGEAPETGRFANLARLLDVEIENIEGNSAGINSVVSFRDDGKEAHFFPDLAARTAVGFLEAVELETAGNPVSSAVRKYLRSLPPKVNKQTYEVLDGGKTTKRVDVGHVKLPEMPAELPSILEIEGSVVGVGFEPGRSEIRVKSNDNNVIMVAPEETVERALEFRHEPVRVLSIRDEKRVRVLHLTKATTPRFKSTPETTEKYLFSRWSGVLARLAK